METVGDAFATTFILAVAVHKLAAVAVTVYVPAEANPALKTMGFCAVAVKVLGPVQLYVLPPEEVRLNAPPPIQREVPIPAVGVGKAFTVVVTILLLTDTPPEVATLR